MTLTPVMIFILGLLMGAAGMLILLVTIGLNVNKTKKKSNIISDDLIKDLFKEYIKETKDER